MNEVVALPKDGDVSKWTAREKALVEASGLVSKGQLAPRATVEAFLAHCRRTGLDPIARQIYAIERKTKWGFKWGIQISIDGARLIAERSSKYAGQTPVEWTSDGVNWVQVWLGKEPPAAARVGVHRSDFKEPLYAVANFDAYNAGTEIWRKMPALMIGKCAEMLALRKAFPQDLSGLYSSEEMAQADVPPAETPQPTSQPTSRPVEAQAEFVEAEVIEKPALAETISEIDNVDELRELWKDLSAEGLLTDDLKQIIRTRVDEVEQKN